MAVVAAAVLVAACGGGRSASRGREPVTDAGSRQVPTMGLTSPAFRDGGTIPVRYSCEGENLHPPLAWTDTPTDAVEIAITVRDPDAPTGTFTHWTVWGIAPSVRSLPAGQLPAGAVEGEASSGKAGYIGPCPPGGDAPHRYEFQVYALGAPLGLAAGAQPDEVLKEIDRVALVGGRLVGRFGRP